MTLVLSTRPDWENDPVDLICAPISAAYDTHTSEKREGQGDDAGLGLMTQRMNDRRKRARKIDAPRARQMRAEGFTIAEVAIELDVSERSVERATETGGKP